MLGIDVMFRHLERWKGIWVAEQRLIILQQNMSVSEEIATLTEYLDHAEAGYTERNLPETTEEERPYVEQLRAAIVQAVPELHVTQRPFVVLSSRAGSYNATKELTGEPIVQYSQSGDPITAVAEAKIIS